MKNTWMYMVVLLFGIAVVAQAHEHKPPHQGTLVVFGEEFSHLEFVLDAKDGKLTVYALDGEAENAVRVPDKNLELKVKLPGGKKEFSMRLSAVANALTGETLGDTSQFEGQSDQLKGVSNFDGVVSAVTLKGQDFKNVKFNYPKGNE